ncbi:uncharacterized protein LOC109860426 [Pseudomyrmex gracilis]|uniref:uncharacterized protein LOC109860426 n=1 Tax=Pseudomyrmex gracilis TaxID=219809 RepID=UPI000995075F|nr:uncharacterized protein LOC109860426 [Pseudomyrmex gracilis]
MSLTVNMLFQAIEDNVIGEIIASAIYVLTHFGYVFWVAYFGQDLSDHSESLFEVTFSSQWYTAPVDIQKLLIFPLQISSRTCAFKVFGGLIIASMKGFASVAVFLPYFCFGIVLKDTRV